MCIVPIFVALTGLIKTRKCGAVVGVRGGGGGGGRVVLPRLAGPAMGGIPALAMLLSALRILCVLSYFGAKNIFSAIFDSLGIS